MSRDPGPTCGFTKPCNVKDGTLVLGASPRPGTSGRFPTTPARPRTPNSAFVGGTPTEEAKSLLRPSLPHGEYGTPLVTLPPFLAKHIGTAVNITQAQLLKYLGESNIRDADLGGSIATDLPAARYFVIHDTSTKPKDWLWRTTFPDGINSPGWAHNKRRNLIDKKDAHVFISRIGDSNTAHDFLQPWSATKYTGGDGTHQPPALKRKFCHVELIQPRLGKPGVKGSDWISPSPGFPGVQLNRLALVYIAASIRHGEWLVPAYHHNIDLGFKAHDDPQNFDLIDWDARVNETVSDILRGVRPGDFPSAPTNRQAG